MSRPLRMLVVHPGADWSTADVYAGLMHGLRHHGVEVVPYRLDERIGVSHKWLHVLWRQKNKARKTAGDEPLPRPTKADMIYHAGVGALEMAMRHGVDVVLVVSGMLLHPDVIVMMKRAGLRVVVLFTESPYDLDAELAYAAMVDGCWTNERTCVPAFLAVNPNSGYLPHAWHPEKHFVSARSLAEVPQYDVVFVGSGFAERIAWFNKIDWTGIDLALYGTWKRLGLKKELHHCIKGDQIDNTYAAALYRRAKVGLNLYRIWSRPQKGGLPERVKGESLSPRAYELAACGAFHLSAYRAEVEETFGSLVPILPENPDDAGALIRRWVMDDAGRAAVSAQLPACVAEATWKERASRVIGDIETLLAHQRAA